MAVDVIVRPGGRCLTVVGDADMAVPDRLALTGPELEGVSRRGRFHIGVLTPDMERAAETCAIAVVVLMDGASVSLSREVPLDRY